MEIIKGAGKPKKRSPCSCTPGCLTTCGCFCIVLSIWGMAQLSVMGCLYYIESAPLILDVTSTDFTSYEEFVLGTRLNYYSTASNCFIAASIYFVTAILGVVCMLVGKHKKKHEVEEDDDDTFCEPPTLEIPQPKKQTTKKNQ